jgi:hypothetical protein
VRSSNGPYKVWKVFKILARKQKKNYPTVPSAAPAAVDAAAYAVTLPVRIISSNRSKEAIFVLYSAKNFFKLASLLPRGATAKASRTPVKSNNWHKWNWPVLRYTVQPKRTYHQRDTLGQSTLAPFPGKSTIGHDQHQTPPVFKPKTQNMYTRFIKSEIHKDKT